MIGIFINSTIPSPRQRVITTTVTGAHLCFKHLTIFHFSTVFIFSHFRPTCPARLIAWNGVVKKKSGEHLHESVKDKISCMLLEQEHLEKVLMENPESTTIKDLMTSISSKLMEDENVLLNNARFMSSEIVLKRRLQRGKQRLMAEQGTKDEPKRSIAKYVNTG